MSSYDRTRAVYTTVPAALILSAFVLTPSFADEPEPGPQIQLEEKIVVTANRLESPADTVGSSVTVITAEEIEARGKTTVAELLRTVAGLDVVRGGGPGQVTSLFLRGGGSSHTLVLLDGVRVNNAATGAFDFADLLSDQIDRIEIVRGPQSTLYGSEAVTGVVSIRTRRGTGDGPSFYGLAEAGDSDHQRLLVGLDGTAGKVDYAVTVSDFETGGVSAAALGNEDDPYENTTFASRLGFDLQGDGRLDLNLRFFQGDVANDGFDFLAGPVDDLNRLQDRESALASLSFRKSFGRLEQSFLVGFHDDELRGSDPDNDFSNFSFGSRRLELTAQSDFHLSESGVLTFGYTYEDRQSAGSSFDESVELHSFFVQNAWTWNDRFALTVGGRHDDHSVFGGETTFRVASSLKAGTGTRFHLSYGTAFKAPTLNDLFFPFFSNPDLEPETNRGYDFGVEQTFGGDVAVLDVTWFENDFEDLIAFDFTTFLPQNLAEAEARGVEVSLKVRPGPGLELRASYTYNDTEDRATGRQLARRPEGRGVLDLFFRPTERLRGTATLLVVRDRIDSDATAMDDYERVDLVLRYRVSERWEPYLRVENLFDEDYEELNGFTTPGSVAVLGLGWRF